MKSGKFYFRKWALPVFVLFAGAGILCAELKVESLTVLDDNPFEGSLPVTIAFGVSADGATVVGMSSYFGVDGQIKQAVLWRGTEVAPLDDLPGGDLVSDGHAEDVSSDGFIAVGKGTGPDGVRALLWDRRTVYELGPALVRGDPVDGSPWTAWATGVSDDGYVVAGVMQSQTHTDAVVWLDRDREARNIREHEGAPSSSQAWGVSPDGTVVVGEMDSPQGHQAFRWDLSGNGEIRGIGELPGGYTFGQALAVSNEGTVIVGISMGEDGEEGFRWENTGENGVMTRLGQIENENESFTCGSNALDISGDGEIIVGMSCEEFLYGNIPSRRPTAVIWHKETDYAIQSLNGLIDEEGSVDRGGFWLETAHAISTDGTTIVGFGVSPDSVFDRPFILKLWRESEPVDDKYAGYPIVDEDGNVDTGSFIGWINVAEGNYIWSYGLNGWMYCDEDSITDSGGWMYVYK